MSESPEEKAKRLGVPLLPPKAIPIHKPSDTVAVCGACGVEIKTVMMMACNRAECPMSSNTFLRGA